MTHRRLTYLQIPPARRRSTAGKILDRLRQSLSDPTLPQAQREAMVGRIKHLNNWAAGKIELKPAKAAAKAEAPKGKDHKVRVNEAVPVVEAGPGGPAEEPDIVIEVED